MPLPSLSPIALEILVPIAALLILAAAFLAVLFCAIVGAGLGRLLYLGARSCANRVLPIFAPIQSVVVGPKAPGTNRGTSERRPSTGTRLRRSRAPSLAPVSGAVNRRPRSSRGKGEEHEGSGHLRREILRQTEVPRLLRLRGALRRLRRPTLHRLHARQPRDARVSRVPGFPHVPGRVLHRRMARTSATRSISGRSSKTRPNILELYGVRRLAAALLRHGSPGQPIPTHPQQNHRSSGPIPLRLATRLAYSHRRSRLSS